MVSEGTSRTKARLAVLSIFLLGVAAGGLGMNLYLRTQNSSPTQAGGPKGGSPEGRVLQKLKTGLALTAEQETQVRTILKETFEKYQNLKEDMRPRFDAVREESRQRIRAILTEEQLPKYEQMERDARERQKRGSGRHGKPDARSDSGEEGDPKRGDDANKTDQGDSKKPDGKSN